MLFRIYYEVEKGSYRTGVCHKTPSGQLKDVCGYSKINRISPPGCFLTKLMVRLRVEKLSNFFSFCIGGKLLMAVDYYYLNKIKLLGLTGFGKAM